MSLHAPNQEMRTSIVPSAKRYPIEDIIDALDNHMMAFVKNRKRNEANNNENPQNGECIGDLSANEYTVNERIKESTRRRAMIEYVMREY